MVLICACGEESGPKVVFVDTTASIERILAERAEIAMAEGWSLPVDGRVVLDPMPEEVAKKFFGSVGDVGSRKVYDRDSYYFARPDMRGRQTMAEHPEGFFPVITNSLGLREDTEVADIKPDLRILVTGDSHTDGVCSNEESFPNRLEALLTARDPGRSVEVLNAGRGSFGFHNYLGVYQKFRYLDSDVFIVGVYLGNDFQGDLKLSAWNRRERLPLVPPAMRQFQSRAIEENAFAFAQTFLQLSWFDHLPETIPRASASAQRVMGEIVRRCEEDGVLLVVLLIPAASDVEWYPHQVKFDRLVTICGLDEKAMRLPWRMGDELEASLAGTPLVDGRDVLVPEHGPYYWLTDKHLNLNGHATLARALLPVVEEGLAARGQH
jgi:hypothetical protein